jgi:hypothetical protein
MRPFIAAVVAAVVLTVAANAQQPTTTNAALRYWTAFAVLQDPPADAATTDLLLRVMDGGATWDEGRLGTILDANADALDIMARASTLRACDWGVEYEHRFLIWRKPGCSGVSACCRACGLPLVVRRPRPSIAGWRACASRSISRRAEP